VNGPVIDEVRRRAEVILGRLGPPAAGLGVLDVGWPPDLPPVPADGDTTWRTEVAVALGTGGVRSATAFYPLVVPEAEALAELASQIQDFAVEATWGEPLPPCPGHPHPLSAHVVDGVAVWECPRDADHHREPILP
jgi:hypothetical protein